MFMSVKSLYDDVISSVDDFLTNGIEVLQYERVLKNSIAIPM